MYDMSTLLTSRPSGPLREPHIAVVIPVYNHSDTVRTVAEQALRRCDCVIVVDDGSTDPVQGCLKGLNVQMLRHHRNRGKGAAILTGAREAEKLGMTHIITIDADGQHDPEDLERFVPLILQAPEAIFVGKRIFGHNVPGASRFGRRFSNFWFRLQTGRPVGDSQSGFRAYPLEVLAQLRLGQNRYSFEVEVIVKASWAGVPVRDVPVSVHYPPASERISHFHLFEDNLRISLLNTWLTLRALLPVPHRRIVTGQPDERAISLIHPIGSLKVLLRENLFPKPLAAAGALGVFLGALPLIACHTLVILGAASFFRLNKMTAITASQICMPPLVPALCIEIGYFVRHGRFLTDISLQTLGYQALERFYEWFLGSLILGPLLALAVALTVYLMAHLLRWGMRSHAE